MTEIENIVLIEQYYEGKLSDTEKTAFETRLQIDANLKNEFTLYKNIVEGIIDAGKENFKAKLKLANAELDEKKVVPLKQKISYKTFALAASILLIIGIYVFWFTQTKTNLAQLADKYYEHEKGLPVTMSIQKNKWDEIMSDYKLADYKQTSYKLNNLLKENTSNDTLNYFFGIVNYELTNYGATRSSLSHITETSAYFDKAQYYLVLMYLQVDDKKAAIQTINQSLLNKTNLFFDKLTLLKQELSK